MSYRYIFRGYSFLSQLSISLNSILSDPLRRCNIHSIPLNRHFLKLGFSTFPARDAIPSIVRALWLGSWQLATRVLHLIFHLSFDFIPKG